MSQQSARVVLMASATLAATETAQTAVDLPAGCSGGWLEISYTRHGSSTTGYPSVRVQISTDGGTNYSDVGVLNTATPASPMPLCSLTIVFATAAGTQARGMYVALPSMRGKIRVQTYDPGDGTNRGTCSVAFTAQVL